MGRNLVLVLLTALLCACTQGPSSEGPLAGTLFPACGNSAELGNGIVLLPHHLLVKDYIEAMYESLSDQEWQHVIIISPDHFGYGPTPISSPDEREHGYTVHRDFAQQYFPDATIDAYRLQSTTTEAQVLTFVDELLTLEASYDTPTLFIFSIDFSHYLPGGIAQVHDFYSMDVLSGRAIEDARSLEVDSPVAVEVLLRLLVAKNEVLVNMQNTNPSYDIGYDTFENTTHVFACSTGLVGEAPTRDLTVQMFFANPEDWYLGRTQENRYLYGYDETFFDQGGTDHAVITNRAKGSTTEIDFDYFE